MNLRQRLLLYCDTHNLNVEEVLPTIKMCLNEVVGDEEFDTNADSLWDEVKDASQVPTPSS